LIVAHSLRTDRIELRGSIDDLRAAVERLDDRPSAPAGSASDVGTGGFAPAPRVPPAPGGATGAERERQVP